MNIERRDEDALRSTIQGNESPRSLVAAHHPQDEILPVSGRAFLIHAAVGKIRNVIVYTILALVMATIFTNFISPDNSWAASFGLAAVIVVSLLSFLGPVYLFYHIAMILRRAARENPQAFSDQNRGKQRYS